MDELTRAAFRIACVAYASALSWKPFRAGRKETGRWNERVRAKRCDAVDWGLLKSLFKMAASVEIGDSLEELEVLE